MKKLFTFLCALACLASAKAYDVVYIVGDSSPAGWSTADADLAKTTMTQVSENVFEWTGILTQTTGEGFKLLTSKSWNPAMHPSTAGLVLNEVGSDVVALPYNGDPDTKWKISETAEYTLRVTFRETDVLVEIEKAGEVGSIVPMVDGVYQISTAAQCEAFAQDVNSGLIPNNCSAVLTQDIDLSSIDAWTAIGTDGKKFFGTFDGQGHRIKGMKLDGSKKEQGFFGVAGAGATIKNLIMDASCNIVSTGGACLAAFVGCCNNNGTITFENCGNEAAVVGKQQNNAGFLGCNYGATQIVFNNCYNTGKISGGRENGAFSGWCGGGATFNNCYNIGEVTEGETWARGTKTINNSYQTVGSDNGVVKVTAEQVASGELCFKLNGDQNTIAWYQKLGEDQYPIPFAKEGAQVYQNATYLCPNKIEGTATYSNSSESTIPDHTYTNGFCEYCDKADVNYLPLVGSAYEIDNMYKLHWFSCIVKDGNVEANANLTADIEMESDNQYGYTPIGTTEHPYVGFFNGQGHSVTLRINNPGYDYQGLFGVVTDGARIEKVVVKGFVTGKAYVGGIVGGTNGGSSNAKQTNIWYCGNEATITANGNNGAGIIGVNMNSQASIIVTSCYNTGNVTSANEGGAISGWLGGGWSSVRNCYNSGIIKNGENASKAFGRNSGCFFSNCYYTETSGTDNTSENTANGKPAMVADATLASGELAYKLIDGFYQTIGTDAYPTTEFTKPSVSYVGDAGYATMYDTTTGYTLNGDVKTYAAVLSGTRLALTEVENVPESTPVVLKGTYYNKLAADLPAINIANDLKGTDVDTAADGTMYILANGADGVGFYKAEGTIPAGKAYFQSSTGVKAFFFDGDDATGISGVDANLNANDAIYNIAGQRIQKMQKGINIINGKKVLF